MIGSCAPFVAQSPGGATEAGSTGGAISSGTTTGAGGPVGGLLSNGTSTNGTGGSSGPNTTNALNHGTIGDNLGATNTTPSPSRGAASPGNAVDTPAANLAQHNLENANTGMRVGAPLYLRRHAAEGTDNDLLS